MRMAILLCAWLAATALAQETKYVQRVVELKYVDARVIADAMFTGSPVKDGYAPQFRYNRELGLITVYGTASDVDQIVANIKALDRPQKASGLATRRNIDARLYILVAGNAPLQGDPLPKELEPLAVQLKTIFPFSDVRLLDIAMFRAKPGMRSEVAGRLPCQANDLAKPVECSYNMRVNLEGVTPSERGALINLESFVFEASFFGSASPGGTRQPVSVSGRFDLTSGQKVVIGKSRIDPEGRNLVLVLTAQAVD